MTDVDQATQRQHLAAHPNASTWLSANAGSGKTRVLTDRVARLLLNEVEPQHILCLTYTKAAASEMQNRLFKRLGTWAMLDDEPLATALAELGLDRKPTLADLRNARTLFARAIETPGGLKIQTIHSFCASLLRRFPLEAGVSPQFTEIEDRAAELLRAELVDTLADGPNATLLTDLAQVYTGGDILKFTHQIVSKGGLRKLGLSEALSLFDADPTLSREKIASATFLKNDADLLRDIMSALTKGSANDTKAADDLGSVINLDFDAIPSMAKVFVFKSGDSTGQPKIGRFPTKATQKRIGHLMPRLDGLMQRVADATEAQKALVAAERTVTLHAFGRAFADLYAAAKQRRGWLDFDDQIQKARDLLSDSRVADWVLFRLDGGIGHILVDEAQDTSPAQWDVIRKLSEEFSSGEGSRPEATRTIFVVGDKKQSIYSFQGADPREFDRMQAEYQSKLKSANQTLNELTLDYSFRSSPAILRLVDSVFEDQDEAGFSKVEHLAFHADLPGRVDLWPLVPKPEREEDSEWFVPLDRRNAVHEDRILADAIAQKMRLMLDNKTLIPDGNAMRPVEPRDFLILVQRRSGIFPEIIRACKKAELPIAGADRLKVGAETAVRDLGALLAFLATPDDSLSLAAALKSPLFGWSEQELFTLAHHRDTEHLWPSLREKETEYPDTVSILKDLRGKIDFMRPYDLIERMLTRHSGRKNLLARLGAEAEDGINALLSQALSYERSAIPSLTGFLTWMETDDLEVKRQIDSASNQIRVMTVHGAKGLEAPIVILPECGQRTLSIKDDIITIKNTPVWRTPSDAQPVNMVARLSAMKEEQKQESLRLLYVALTRAEKWLIVAASGKLDSKGDDWHQRIQRGMSDGGSTALETPVGPGLRLEYGNWTIEAKGDKARNTPSEKALPQLYQHSVPARQPPLSIVSPSKLGGDKALPGEGMDEETAKSYGTLVHQFLEVLPSVKKGEWSETIKRLSEVARLTDALKAEAAAEACRVLQQTDIAHLFDSATLAEVPITADLGVHRIHGNIDRLIVSDTTVDIVDFKTNRTVPSLAINCPEGVLRQLGAYAHAIAQIYPNHLIKTHVLWTKSGHLMHLPHDIVSEAIARTPYLDDWQSGS
ncbi:MAG: double-strand break repair helicase AddA [Tateyamaria sp.]|nr:double-strand break repair helicase AddA [Tateyamaria sp.]